MNIIKSDVINKNKRIVLISRSGIYLVNIIRKVKKYKYHIIPYYEEKVDNLFNTDNYDFAEYMYNSLLKDYKYKKENNHDK